MLATSAASVSGSNRSRYRFTARTKKRSPAGKRRFTPFAMCVADPLFANQCFGTSANATFGVRGRMRGAENDGSRPAWLMVLVIVLIERKSIRAKLGFMAVPAKRRLER